MFDEKSRNRIIEIQDQIEELESEQKALLEGLQKGCAHPWVVECDSLFPQRLCIICGLVEGVWMPHRYTIRAVPFCTLPAEVFNRYKKLQPLAIFGVLSPSGRAAEVMQETLVLMQSQLQNYEKIT